MKILFILKKRNESWEVNKDDYCSYGSSKNSGLFNSATFVSDMLNHNGIESVIVQVNDNNDIDREVSLNNPTHVIIEALWVVPEKFDVLQRLHPDVKWIIRIHSKLAFLSGEGMAMDWLLEYIKYKNVYIGCNSLPTKKEFCHLSEMKNFKDKVLFLPNYYPVVEVEHSCVEKSKRIDVGCFGAIRPLKNQLVQATAAIMCADRLGKCLHFHINGKRIEGKGEPVLKNIEKLFEKFPQHKLVKHTWKDHKDFLKLCSRMDIGLQVSMSETFNIVSADLVTSDVPVVISNEIGWTFPLFRIKNVNSSKRISDTMIFLLKFKFIGRIFSFLNKICLKWYSYHSKRKWVNLKKIE